MTWFTENPLPPVLLGVIAEALLAVVLMRTGRRSILWCMLGIAAAVIGIVVLERAIVTPREEVKQALEEIRGLVQTNDRQGLLQRIDANPNVAELRNRVQHDLAQITVVEAKITDLQDQDIKIDPAGTSARVRFIGSVTLKESPRVPRGHIVLRFDVDMRKKDGKWVITAAEYHSPL